MLTQANAANVPNVCTLSIKKSIAHLLVSGFKSHLNERLRLFGLRSSVANNLLAYGFSLLQKHLKRGPRLSKHHTEKTKSDTPNAIHLTSLAKVNTTFYNYINFFSKDTFTHKHHIMTYFHWQLYKDMLNLKQFSNDTC